MKSYLHQEGDDAFLKLVQVFKTHLLLSPAVSLGVLEGNKFLFSNEYKLVQGSWPRSATRLFGRGSILSKTGKEHKDESIAY